MFDEFNNQEAEVQLEAKIEEKKEQFKSLIHLELIFV